MRENGPERPEFRFRAIGIIHSPFQEPAQTLIQPVFATEVRGRVEVFPEYAEGLTDLEGFSHVHLIYVFDRVSEMKLRVRPYLSSGRRARHLRDANADSSEPYRNEPRAAARPGRHDVACGGVGYSGWHTAPGRQALCATG